MKLKKYVNRYIIHPLKRALYGRSFRSDHYWEKRYKNNGNSGHGSYGRLSKFKATTINTFVECNDVSSIIEHGCGDGYQLSLYNFDRYIGLDVSETTIELCKKKFHFDKSKTFSVYGNDIDKERCDLSMSIDVIFHLVEDHVFNNYMERLFSSAKKFVCIYSSNENSKNTAMHVRHRKFTDWVQENCSEWQLMETIKNIYPAKIGHEDRENSFSDFHFFRKAH